MYCYIQDPDYIAEGKLVELLDKKYSESSELTVAVEEITNELNLEMESKRDDFLRSLSTAMGWGQNVEGNLLERMMSFDKKIIRLHADHIIDEELPPPVTLDSKGRVTESEPIGPNEYDLEAIHKATNDDELDEISEIRMKNDREWKHVIALTYVKNFCGEKSEELLQKLVTYYTVGNYNNRFKDFIANVIEKHRQIDAQHIFNERMPDPKNGVGTVDTIERERRPSDEPSGHSSGKDTRIPWAGSLPQLKVICSHLQERGMVYPSQVEAFNEEILPHFCVSGMSAPNLANGKIIWRGTNGDILRFFQLLKDYEYINDSEFRYRNSYIESNFSLHEKNHCFSKDSLSQEWKNCKDPIFIKKATEASDDFEQVGVANRS